MPDRPLRISLSITHYPDGSGATLDDIARAADDGGLDTLWVVDHLVQNAPASDPDGPVLEAYTTLGHLAGRTSRVRLGTMVAGVTFRPATLLVKAVTTLDVLSEGRAWLGVGAGHDEREAVAMGLPLPPARERYEWLEDTLELAHRMWAGDGTAFAGRRVHAGRPRNSPPAVQRPHPPILVGGHGERRTLPLVARYADACNLFDIPDGGATVRRKLDVLARACDAAGRPAGEIEKTISTRLGADETPAAFATRCTALAGLGIEHAVVIGPGPWTRDGIARLVETARLLRR